MLHNRGIYMVMAHLWLGRKSSVQFLTGKVMSQPSRRFSLYEHSGPAKKEETTHELQVSQHTVTITHSCTYIVLIGGWSFVLWTIQLRSDRQSEHPGDSYIKVVFVYKWALQIVHIWSWNASLMVIWSPGSLVKTMKTSQQNPKLSITAMAKYNYIQGHLYIFLDILGDLATFGCACYN